MRIEVVALRAWAPSTHILMKSLIPFLTACLAVSLQSCDSPDNSSTQHRSNTDPESGSMEASRLSGSGNQNASGPAGKSEEGKAAPTTVR
jgi:hypothetical protein